MAASRVPQVTVKSLNPLLVEAQYAVRGAIVIKAMAHEEALKRGESRPFEKIIYCNIGNPQQLAQKPITFPRQVLAGMVYPELMETADFPADVVERVAKYAAEVPGGTGAYSESQGIKIVRSEVAEFLEERDGVPASPDNIFLTDGASPGVQRLISSLIRDKSDGFLVPIPQYPLYSASIALYGGTMVPYELDEETNWGMKIDTIAESLEKAKADGINVRGLTVINPGNPTGGCLTRENAEEVVRFCADNNLVLMADEVYQENVWAEGKSFTSFKKVAAEMGVISPDTDEFVELQLVSFHSVSKGFLGECGRRGGYFETIGFGKDVKDQLYKSASISLCPNVMGQLMVGLMVNPPRPGSPSYELYSSERDAILASMRRRATKLADAYASLEGVSCQAPEGAMYIFPKIELPPKACEAAAAEGVQPDALYCTRLLDATGVVIVPGSGFGQADGTFHFRTTILPQEDEVDAVVARLNDFHSAFMAEFK